VNIKSVPWIFVGILIGYILGGILPKLEFEQRKSELQEIIDSLESSNHYKGATGSYIPLVSEAINEQNEANVRKDTLDKKNTDKVVASKKIEQYEVVEEEIVYSEDEIVPYGEAEEFDEEESFRDFVELQQMRAEQSRMALIEQANFSEEQIEKLDDIFDDLNGNLAEHSDQIWELMENSRNGIEPEEIEIYDFTHKMSGILYESQSELENLIGDQNVDKEAKRIYNHIDMEFLLEVIDEDYAQ